MAKLYGKMEFDNFYGRFVLKAEDETIRLKQFFKKNPVLRITTTLNDYDVIMREEDTTHHGRRTKKETSSPESDVGRKKRIKVIAAVTVKGPPPAPPSPEQKDPLSTPPLHKGGAIKNITDKKILNMINYFDFGIADTMHDFGGTRNGIFPADHSPGSFLAQAKLFLDYTDLGYKSDPFKMYYEGNFSDFEKRVKIDYILGKFCDVYGINFYFNQDIKSFAKPDSDILLPFVANEPKKLAFFYETNLNNQGYKYYFLDACMSIQCDQEFKKMTALKSLCDLWDPVGSSELAENQMAEMNKELNITFLHEEGGDRTIYNAFVNGIEESLYDKAYDPLLNVKCLEEKGIFFHLRLKKIEDPKMNKYIVNMLIKHGTETKSFPLKSGGFSLHDLAVGLAYVDDTYVDKQKIKNEIHPDLKSIIDYVKGIQQPVGGITEVDLKRMLTRFKSSGDHGSARTASIVNSYCGAAKDKTIYLSGDQLCYVYSMLIGNPTLFRYYAPPSKTKEEVETCGVCTDKNRLHFLGFFSPKKNIIFYENIVLRCRGFIETYMKHLIDGTDGSTNKEAVLTLSQTEKHKKTIENLTVREQLDFIKEKPVLQTMIGEIFLSLGILLKDIHAPDASLDDIGKILLQMEDLLHSVYYLMNKEKLVNEFKQVFAKQQEIVDEYMKKDDGTGRSSSRRNQKQGIKLDDALKKHYNEYAKEKGKPGKHKKFSLFLSTKIPEYWNTCVQKIKVYKKLTTTFLSGLKTTIGPASNVVNEKMVNELLKSEMARSVELQELDSEFGKAIVEMFDMANTEPVVAIPIPPPLAVPSPVPSHAKKTTKRKQLTQGGRRSRSKRNMSNKVHRRRHPVRISQVQS